LDELKAQSLSGKISTEEISRTNRGKKNSIIVRIQNRGNKTSFKPKVLHITYLIYFCDLTPRMLQFFFFLFISQQFISDLLELW